MTLAAVLEEQDDAPKNAYVIADMVWPEGQLSVR